MEKIILSLLIFFLLLMTQEVNGQELEWLDSDSLIDLSTPKISSFLELGTSANTYNGDLASFQKWSSSFHAGVLFNKNSKINGRIGLSLGFITGDNKFYRFDDGTSVRTTPNNFFRANLFTLHYELHYHFIKTRNLMLYFSQGLGIMRFTTKDKNGDNLADKQDSRALDESYGNVSLMLPTGLGAAYILRNGYGLGFQAMLLNQMSDYIDNISQWGTKSGNDNTLMCKFFILAPLIKQPVKPFPKKSQRYYSH